MIALDTLPSSEVNESVYRIILSRYPQIHLFERVSNPQDWEVLYAVESLTNPRLRDEVGDIRLVPPEDRVYGDGASWIMAAFTHPPVDGRGGRFNRDFGIYYCAADEAVAIAESSYHRARFLRESRIDKTSQEMRVIRAQLGPTTLHDVRHLAEDAIYDPENYGEAHATAIERFDVDYRSLVIVVAQITPVDRIGQRSGTHHSVALPLRSHALVVNTKAFRIT